MTVIDIALNINKPKGLNEQATRERISRLIKESGKSNKELGDLLVLREQTISKWRNCKGIPDLENLYLLSRIFNVKVDDMLVPNTDLVFLKEKIEYAENTAQLGRIKLYAEKIKSIKWKKRSENKKNEVKL